MNNDTDRALDADLGVPDVPDPGVPADAVPVVTDWEPPTDDETVQANTEVGPDDAPHFWPMRGASHE